MISFVYKVKKSFMKDGGNHPITIPRHKQRLLRTEDLDLDAITVILPRGERYRGNIYQGYSKGEDYYQLWFAPAVKRWKRPPFAPYIGTGDSYVDRLV